MTAPNTAPAIRDPRDPLPLTLPTLDFLPDEYRRQYARTLDGSFRLSWIHADDEASKLAHLAAISTSRLDVVAAGETPESVVEQQAANARAFEAALADAEQRQAAQFAEQQRQREAQQRTRADRDAELRRHGMLTADDYRALNAGREVES